MACAFVLLAVVSGLGAQQPNDCSQRSIPLTVIKNSNSNWDWHSLTLTVGGRQIPIESVSVTPQPPRVLLLVDTSGSMGPQNSSRNWGIGLLAAAFAVNATPLESPISLGTFSLGHKLGNFESREDVGRELVALSEKKPGQATALYAALRNTASELQPGRFGDAIFLVTDGGDNRSGELQKKARQELIAHGIRVFVFLVSDKDFKTPEERDAPIDMTDLANATGGAIIQGMWSKQWLASDDAKRLAEQVRTMARWPYMLQFKLDQPLQKPAKLKISPPDKRSLELAYPREVLPCFALTGKSR